VDLGSDDGSNLRRIAKSVKARTAMGVDFRAVDGVRHGIHFRRGNILEFVPDQEYDLVISNQVFEHIYERWLPKYFAVLRRCCAPGGLILLSTPNRWRSRNLVRLATLRRPYIMNPNPGIPPEQHLGHHRECSYRELRTILREEFPGPEFRVRIFRAFPTSENSVSRWLAQVLVYVAAWPLWRLLFVSASQDHYAVIERRVSDRTPQPLEGEPRHPDTGRIPQLG
jgi:cyclopropane fatty-acyl-phospholipid synthase-like methyltransferase